MDDYEYSQGDEERNKEISDRFYLNLKEPSSGLALIPVKYPRYFGENFEVYRQKYCGKKIKDHDFRTLEPLEWLNDTTVNYYMELIEKRSKKYAYLPKVYSFNSFFYNAYRKNGYDGIKSWIDKNRIFEFDYILLPIHDHAHWFMIIVDVNAKVIGSFDSLGRNGGTTHLEHVRKLLITHAEDIEDSTNELADWEIFIDKKAPRQLNGYDCGVYACQYAQYVTKRRVLEFRQSQMNYFRKRMQYELLKNRLLND